MRIEEIDFRDNEHYKRIEFAINSSEPPAAAKADMDWLDKVLEENRDYLKGYELTLKDKWDYDSALNKACYNYIQEKNNHSLSREEALKLAKQERERLIKEGDL